MEASMSDEYRSEEGPICPYCKEGITADEGYFYDEDLTEMECGHCLEKYAVQVCLSASWTTSKKGNQ